MRRSRVNQRIITGPKKRPDSCGAAALHGEQPHDDHRGDRHDQIPEAGVDHLMPSTADSTEIAGVIMLSPKNSAAPNMPAAAKDR